MSFGKLVIVDWEAYCSPWTVYFTKLWNTPEFADVVIQCKNDVLKCHSIILAAHSEHFHSAFLTNEKNVRIEEVQFRELKTILGFMYTGRVIIDRDQLGALLEAAKTLLVTKLIELIETKSYTTLEKFISIQDKDNGANNNCDPSPVSNCQQTTNPTAQVELSRVKKECPQLQSALPPPPPLIAKPLENTVIATSSIPSPPPLTLNMPTNRELATMLARLSQMGVVIQVERKSSTGDEDLPMAENCIFQRPDSSPPKPVMVGQPTPATSTVTESESNNSSTEEQELAEKSIEFVIIDDTESKSETAAATAVDAGCQTDTVNMSDNVKVNIGHGVTVTGTALSSVVSAADAGARFSEYQRPTSYPYEVRETALNDLRTGNVSLMDYSRMTGISESALRVWQNSERVMKGEWNSKIRSKSELYRRYKKAQELIEQGTLLSAAAKEAGVARSSLTAYLQRNGLKVSNTGKGKAESKGKKKKKLGVTAATSTVTAQNGCIRVGDNKNDGVGVGPNQTNCVVWTVWS